MGTASVPPNMGGEAKTMEGQVQILREQLAEVTEIIAVLAISLGAYLKMPESVVLGCLRNSAKVAYTVYPERYRAPSDGQGRTDAPIKA